MGVNTQAEQPAQNLSPEQQLQMQRLNGLKTFATTPYRGSAPGGGTAQGVAQLVAALLAKQRQQQLMRQFANPNGMTMDSPNQQMNPMQPMGPQNA